MAYPQISRLEARVDAAAASKLAALNEGRLTNVKFLVGKSDETAQEFHAFEHDLLLGSEYFRALITGPFQEGATKVVRIKDESPEVFLNLLMFLHVFALPKNLMLDDYIKLGILGDKYLVNTLVERCANAIGNMVFVDNIWETIDQVIRIPKLARACNEALKTCGRDAFVTPQTGTSLTFFDITEETLVYFLKLEELHVEESFLVDQCINLHKHRVQNGEENLIRAAIPHLRLLTLPTDDTLKRICAYLTVEERLALYEKMFFDSSEPLPSTICSITTKRYSEYSPPMSPNYCTSHSEYSPRPTTPNYCQGYSDCRTPSPV